MVVIVDLPLPFFFFSRKVNNNFTLYYSYFNGGFHLDIRWPRNLWSLTLGLISRAANKTLKYIHLIAALDFKSKGWVTTNSLVTRWPGERDLWIQCEVGVGQLNIDDQFHFLKHHPELYFRLKFYYYYSLSNRLHRFSVILYAGEATITFIFFTFLSSLCITVHSSSENQS